MSTLHSITRVLRNAWNEDTHRDQEGRNCPDPERLYDAATGQLAADESRALIAHTIECGACAQSWRVALELDRAGRTGDGANNVRPLPRRPLLPPWALAAAEALSLAIGLAYLLPHLDQPIPPPGQNPVWRGAESTPIEPLIPERARLSADGFRLSWQAHPASPEYELTLTGANLEQVYSIRTEMTEITVPKDILGALDPGSELLWQVSAKLDDGATLRSATRTVILDDAGVDKP